MRTHTGPISSRSHVITPLLVAYENQTAFLSLSRRGTETADLLLRFGREFVACNVLSYDMRFSVLSLNTFIMAESVFAMRLVNLWSVTCYTDQNF